MALANVSTKQGGLARGFRIAIGWLLERPSRRAALMARPGDTSYGEVRHVECFFGLAAPVVLTMPIWNRQQDKPPRGTYTGWSEVQLEKWGFGCPNDTDVERTRYTMITQGLHWPITLHSRRYDILHNYILYV